MNTSNVSCESMPSDSAYDTHLTTTIMAYGGVLYEAAVRSGTLCRDFQKRCSTLQGPVYQYTAYYPEGASEPSDETLGGGFLTIGEAPASDSDEPTTVGSSLAITQDAYAFGMIGGEKIMGHLYNLSLPQKERVAKFLGRRAMGIPATIAYHRQHHA